MASRFPARGLRRHASPCSASIRPSWSLADLHRARCISQTYLQKVAAGDERWKERAQEIKRGDIPNLWDVLDERGYIKGVAGDVDRIKEVMRIKRIGAYVGVDPTADSMHVGHLVAFMPLFWMWLHGHPAVTLLGGSTARIGDPTGRLNSRAVMSNADITKNITKIHLQLTRLWTNMVNIRDRYKYPNDWAAKRHLLNNSMWLQGLSMYEFTKRIARHTRMGPMLSRETVKRKLTEGDGMSLGEFMYPLLQGWDFWHMYNKLGIQMQIGGSDQFGNIVAGIDILKTIRSTEEAPWAKMPTEWQHEPIGFTVPLLTDSAGVKYGKSEGNAVWLDEFKTSSFDLYGYFMRRSDDDVEKYLKLLTFLPTNRIKGIMTEHRKDPSKREAQHMLAFEVLTLVHGSDKATQEAMQHQYRFGGELPSVVRLPPKDSGIVVPNNAPRSDIVLPRSIMELSPAKLLHAAGLAESSSEAHRLVTQGGAAVAASPGQDRGLVPGNLSWTPMKAWFPGEAAKFLIEDRLLILRRGKHNVRIIELISDEEWKKSGKSYPGEPYTGFLKRMKQQLVAAAEKRGETLTTVEVNKMLKKAMARKVANNPDIELPSKQEVRERAKGRRREPRKSPGEQSRDEEW